MSDPSPKPSVGVSVGAVGKHENPRHAPKYFNTVFADEQAGKEAMAKVLLDNGLEDYAHTIASKDLGYRGPDFTGKYMITAGPIPGSKMPAVLKLDV